MSYSNEVYKTAHDILKEKRDRNSYILEKRKNEISEKIPEYSDVKKESVFLLSDFIKNIDKSNRGDAKKIKEVVRENESKRKKLLSDNGYPENYLDEIYECEKCKDTGYVMGDKCSCLKKLLIDIAAKNSNLNNLILNQNFDNFNLDVFSDEKADGISPKENMKNILSHIKKFILEFRNSETKSLLFLGDTGVGKTYLSSCIAKKMIDEGYFVIYQSAGELLETLENYKFNRNNSSYEMVKAVNDINNSDLLIIDDLGTEFKTNYTLSQIFELINTRLVNNKKIIINTNLSVKELKDIYSERLFSRFLGDFNILQFTGEDLRTKEIF